MLATFAVTTFVDEPSTLVAILVVLVVSVVLDVGWQHSRRTRIAVS